FMILFFEIISIVELGATMPLSFARRLFYVRFKDIFYEAVIISKTSEFQMSDNRIITKKYICAKSAANFNRSYWRAWVQ
ncbi:MAG: hypothetical protein RR389_05515, partial [Christensenella sp.]